MNVTVRKADKVDIDALARLYVEFHNFHALGIPSRMRTVESDEPLLQAIGDLLDNPQVAVFVASLDNEVCGFAEVYLRETESTAALVPRKYAYLQSLMVTAAVRKQGVGRLLVQAAHEWAVHNGAAAIELETWEFGGGPLRFYESLGFKTVKRTLVLELGLPT